MTFSTKDRWTLPESVRGLVLDVILRGHEQRFALHAAVVMPDHVHIVLTPSKDAEGNTYGLVQILNSIKGASAHAVNDGLRRRGAVWQSESFDRTIRSDEDVKAKAEYVCANPVRAGLVADEDQYRWLWREWVEGPIPNND